MLKKWIFTDVNRIISTGKKRKLSIKDLPDLPAYWKPLHSIEFSQIQTTQPDDLIQTVLKIVRPQLTNLVLLISLLILFRFSVPVLLKSFLHQISIDQNNLIFNLGLAVCLCLSQLGQALVGQQYIYHAVTSSQTGINYLNQYFHHYILLYSNSSHQSDGWINRIHSDSELVGAVLWQYLEISQIILTIFISCGFLFYFLGASFLPSIFILVLMFPFGRWFSKKFSTSQLQLMNLKDSRIGKMSQFLDGIRVIKSFVWENFVAKRIKFFRKEEEKVGLKIAGHKALSIGIFNFSNTLSAFFALWLFSKTGAELDPSLIFTVFALYSTLEPCLRQLPRQLGELFSTKVAAKRLSEKTIDLRNHSFQFYHDPNSNHLIEIQNGKLELNNNLIFQDLNLTINEGESVAIIGSVGCGKSTLLKLILKQMKLLQGTLNISKNINFSYVPQDAFLFAGSLRDNITLGREVDSLELNDVIQVSHLGPDIESLPGGLDFIVHEGGANLSGGQKQRINIARAVLKKSDVYVMDDPFSALDPATEEYIANDLMFNYLCNKTRIISTHRFDFLHRFDRIILVNDGRVSFQGTFKELTANSSKFEEFSVKSNPKTPNLEGKKITDKKQSILAPVIFDQSSEGPVKPSLFLNYFKAMGEYKTPLFLRSITVLVGVSLLAMLMPVFQNKWISDWSNHPDAYQFYLLIYLLIGVISAVTLAFQHFTWAKRSIIAAHSIHDKALNGVLRSRLNFFDSTTSGRILNRFTKDLDSVEKDLSWSIEDSFMSFLNTLGSLLVMLFNLPIMILAALPISLLYWKIQKSYRVCMIEAKRLTSSLRGPRILSLRESLEGLDVIRVFNSQNYFEKKFSTALGDYQKAFHGVVLINRWFSTRIPLISTLFSLLVCLTIVLMGHFLGFPVGIAGFILMYSFRLSENLNWNVRAFGEAEAHMTSFERLKDYGELDPEIDKLSDTESNEVEGHIKFNNVFARYSPDSPDILKGATFSIKAGSKVGLIGRTGAGKSTIFSLLFRFIESREGEILIDGKNINLIPLNFLRENIATIPQNPILFSGTLRENLDPMQNFSDEELLRVLNRTHVNFLSHGLDTIIKEGGKNLSRGQRQLICLARVLLRKSKIVIVDEASSSVDLKTDKLIQEILFQDCPDRTVLIISHRNETLKGCDSIIEMSDGKIFCAI